MALKDDRIEQCLVGVNSKCGVQSKRRCESHESCVCIVGFPACGCQNENEQIVSRAKLFINLLKKVSQFATRTSVLHQLSACADICTVLQGGLCFKGACALILSSYHCYSWHCSCCDRCASVHVPLGLPADHHVLTLYLTVALRLPADHQVLVNTVPYCRPSGTSYHCSLLQTIRY